MNLATLSFDQINQAFNESITPYRWLWAQFDAFFVANGLRLWIAHPQDETLSIPPDERQRAPDGFSYRSRNDVDTQRWFSHGTPLLHPARTLDGRDVVVRIICIGDDGRSHVQALKRLATGHIASAIGNHTIPVLQWLNVDEITFAVFPMLSSIDPTHIYLYEDTRDLLGHVRQMLEALDFCHSNLVVHRDVFSQNFLSNFEDGSDFHRSHTPPKPGEAVKPFRSLFPFKLFLIDFECAVCFDEDSDPATRLLAGKPTFAGAGGAYARPVAPEMLTEEPYNPFLTDVWQLGTYFSEVAERHTFPESARALIDRMKATLPSDRPTARESLQELDDITTGLTLDELKAPVWIRPTPRAKVPSNDP